MAANDTQAISIARSVYLFALFVPPVFLHLTFSLLGLPKTDRDRVLLRSSYAVSVLFLPFIFTDLFIIKVIRYAPFFGVVPGFFYTAFVAFFGLTCAVGFIKLLQGYRIASGLSRNQLRYIFISWLMAYVAGLLHFMPTYIGFEPFPHDFLVIAFVALSSYAIVKYRIMDIRVAIARTAILIVVYALLLGAPLIVLARYQTPLFVFVQMNRWSAPLLAGLYAVLVSFAPIVYLALQRRTEDRLLAVQRRYQSVLRQAAQGMILIKEMKKLLNLIVHLLTAKVRLRHAAIYLWDEKTKRFYPSAARQWPVKDPPTFAPGDVLVEYINWHRTPVVTEELYLQARGGVKELQGVVVSLKNLQTAVLIPSFTEDRCEGFLLLGDKVSNELFTSDDLQVFQVLASQAALAIENAQFYEELKRTQTDLFQTAKMASLGHMAGGMSHQINNRFHVLTILAGTLRSVMKDMNPAVEERRKLQEIWAKALETLTKLEENAFRGGDIVKTLLKFSRPSGDYKPLVLAQVVKTAKDVAQFRVNMATIDFREDIPEDLPKIKGDMNQLADGVFNLITNAFDAVSKKTAMFEEKQLEPSPNDPVPFRGKLWVRAFRERSDDKDFVVLEFQDNGIGMTSAEVDNIFVPFFTTKATAQKGTGLGLYVIQRIIEQHGGTVTAKSKYSVGTTFIFRLPTYEEAANG